MRAENSNHALNAVSLAREGLLSKACQVLTSGGIALNNDTTWGLLQSKHPKSALPCPPICSQSTKPLLPPNFNIMAVLNSFPKDTACGPSGLRIQHLIDAAEVPLQLPITSLLHSLGTISSESGVQQGDPMGSLLFCLVLQKLVSAIAEDKDCSSLLFHKWYIDDSVIAGPKQAVAHALSIIQDLGPPLGLHINIAKCELYSPCDLSLFPSDMKRFTSPHIEILGAPIGDIIFCGKFVAQKRAEARHLLTQLEEVGSVDPQVALLLLRLCGSFCRLVHLARSTPPSLIVDGLDNDVRHCFAECTMVDTSDAAWQQAQLSLSRGGLGLRRLSLHSPAAYIASAVASDCSSPQSKHLLHAIDLFNASVPTTDELTITSITTSNLTQKLLNG